jgi:hypothetical protein
MDRKSACRLHSVALIYFFVLFLQSIRICPLSLNKSVQLLIISELQNVQLYLLQVREDGAFCPGMSRRRGQANISIFLVFFVKSKYISS